MKIKLLTSLAGDGFAHEYGAVIDFDDADAARLIERDLAVAMVEPAPPANAVDAKAVHRGRGSWSVMVAGTEVVEGLSRDEAAEFNALSGESKADFIAARKG